MAKIVALRSIIWSIPSKRLKIYTFIVVVVVFGGGGGSGFIFNSFFIFTNKYLLTKKGNIITFVSRPSFERFKKSKYA